MKLFILFVSVAFSFKSHALLTKNCLNSFTVNVTETESFSRNFVEARIEEQREEYFFSNSFEFNQDEVDYIVDRPLDGFEFSVTLEEKRNSNCYYTSDNPKVLFPKLVGTHEDALFTFTYNPEGELFYGFKTNPTQKEPHYTFEDERTQIKMDVTVHYDNWGHIEERVEIPVGRGLLNSAE